MFVFPLKLRRRITATTILLVLLFSPTEIYALGLSPPEVDLGYVPAGSTYTVRAQISRAVNEMDGSLYIMVTPGNSAADFFVGEPSFIIPAGQNQFNYLFSVAPTFATAQQQELYVTFLLSPSAIVSSGVSVITGITQVVRFTTDVVTSTASSATVPGSPTGLRSESSDGQAIFRFTPPANDGGSAITSYVVTCTAPSGSTGLGSGTQSPVVVTGLVNGETYSCWVQARNTAGTSLSSDTVSTQPLVTSPGGGSQGGSRKGESRAPSTPSDKKDASRPALPKKPSAPSKSPVRTGEDSGTQPSPTSVDTPVSTGEEATLEQGERSSDATVQEESPWWMFWKSPSADADVKAGEGAKSELGAAPKAEHSVDESEPSSEAVVESAPARPPAPRIQSPTHPSEDTFVSSGDVTFNLREEGPGQDVPTRFMINGESTVQASELLNETSNPSISLHLPDGIYYLHTQEASDASAPVSTRRVMIDTTPPAVAVRVPISSVIPLIPTKREIEISALDELAGISEVSASLNAKSIEIEDNRISTRGLGWGTHTLSVEATDLAGNVIEKTFAVEVTPKYPIAQVVSRATEAIKSLFSFFKR